jgi:hypothetical protein
MGFEAGEFALGELPRWAGLGRDAGCVRGTGPCVCAWIWVLGFGFRVFPGSGNISQKRKAQAEGPAPIFTLYTYYITAEGVFETCSSDLFPY